LLEIFRKKVGLFMTRSKPGDPLHRRFACFSVSFSLFLTAQKKNFLKKQTAGFLRILFTKKAF